MNKSETVLIAILGGVDAVITILTPILLSFLWISYANLFGWKAYLFLAVGFLATLFRGIRIGFLKQ